MGKSHRGEPSHITTSSNEESDNESDDFRQHRLKKKRKASRRSNGSSSPEDGRNRKKYGDDSRSRRNARKHDKTLEDRERHSITIRHHQKRDSGTSESSFSDSAIEDEARPKLHNILTSSKLKDRPHQRQKVESKNRYSSKYEDNKVLLKSKKKHESVDGVETRVIQCICPFCDAVFTEKSELKEHIGQNHVKNAQQKRRSGTYDSSCSDSASEVEAQQNTPQEIRSSKVKDRQHDRDNVEHKIRYSSPQESNQDNRALSKSKKKHEAVDGVETRVIPSICPYCDAVFTEKSELKEHIEQNHVKNAQQKRRSGTYDSPCSDSASEVEAQQNTHQNIRRSKVKDRQHDRDNVEDKIRYSFPESNQDNRVVSKSKKKHESKSSQIKHRRKRDSGTSDTTGCEYTSGDEAPTKSRQDRRSSKTKHRSHHGYNVEQKIRYSSSDSDEDNEVVLTSSKKHEYKSRDSSQIDGHTSRKYSELDTKAKKRTISRNRNELQSLASSPLDGETSGKYHEDIKQRHRTESRKGHQSRIIQSICPFCDAVFTEISELKEHIEQNHVKNAQGKSSQKGKETLRKHRDDGKQKDRSETRKRKYSKSPDSCPVGVETSGTNRDDGKQKLKNRYSSSYITDRTDNRKRKYSSSRDASPCSDEAVQKNLEHEEIREKTNSRKRHQSKVHDSSVDVDDNKPSDRQDRRRTEDKRGNRKRKYSSSPDSSPNNAEALQKNREHEKVMETKRQKSKSRDSSPDDDHNKRRDRQDPKRRKETKKGYSSDPDEISEKYVEGKGTISIEKKGINDTSDKSYGDFREGSPFKFTVGKEKQTAKKVDNDGVSYEVYSDHEEISTAYDSGSEAGSFQGFTALNTGDDEDMSNDLNTAEKPKGRETVVKQCVCPYCEAVFKEKSDLKEHIDENHLKKNGEDEKIMEGNDSRKRKESKDSRQRDESKNRDSLVAGVETPVTPSICPYCEVFFKEKSVLKEHIDEMHVNKNGEDEKIMERTESEKRQQSRLSRKIEASTSHDSSVGGENHVKKNGEEEKSMERNDSRKKKESKDSRQRDESENRDSLFDVVEKLATHSICPYCDGVFKEKSELKEHIEQNHVKNAQQKSLFPCHLCNFVCEESKSFGNHFVEYHQSSQKGKEVPSYPLVKDFNEDNENGMQWGKFKNHLKSHDMVEVETPANGYCFLSALMVTLGEQGINKDFYNLSIEITNEASMYQSMKFQHDEDGNKISEEDLKAGCAAFFEKGEYTNEYVDICINSAANALGINLYIFQRRANKVTLVPFLCGRFTSKVSVFLLFYNKKCRKGTENHYNALVKADYYKSNELSIKSRMVSVERESDSEQIKRDLALAQQLSREEMNRPNGENRYLLFLLIMNHFFKEYVEELVKYRYCLKRIMFHIYFSHRY